MHILVYTVYIYINASKYTECLGWKIRLKNDIFVTSRTRSDIYNGFVWDY